ncbi:MULTISPECIES: phage holin [Bacillati]|uniref:Holin n=1 Tax=uncultured Caudovirales phage TaxID=2100421 RepID=A0A2H4JCH4_9CAUD|nr:phage holin [Staphylococcus epidermidis]ASN71673.1 hypothetical protein 3S1_36 [uncultured Caudovirales phage]MBW7480107.1 phage holin [Streptococcus pneumoniae]UYO29263.1 phage holin [Staphylococcus epidermidis]
MKVNWTTRLKNGTTLTALVGAVLLFAKQVTEAFGIDISSQLETISSILGSIITILVALGVVTNPNTKGLSDAGIDLELSKPRNQDMHPVEFKTNDKKVVVPNALTPKEYDTSEDFTDDTDEVDFDVAEYEDDEDLPRGASKLHDDDMLKVGDKDDSETN